MGSCGSACHAYTHSWCSLQSWSPSRQQGLLTEVPPQSEAKINLEQHATPTLEPPAPTWTTLTTPPLWAAMTTASGPAAFTEYGCGTIFRTTTMPTSINQPTMHGMNIIAWTSQAASGIPLRLSDIPAPQMDINMIRSTFMRGTTTWVMSIFTTMMRHLLPRTTWETLLS